MVDANAPARPIRTVEPMLSPAPSQDIPIASPPYDLLADRARITSMIRSELGANAQTGVAGDLFVLGAPAKGGAVASVLPFVERVLEALFNDRFRTRPARAISVYLFPDASSYDRYCRATFQEACISIYGFFSPEHNSLVMNIGLGIGTLSHELVHPIFDADFPKAPTWLNEGIASLYEAPVMPKRGEIHGRKNWRYPRLQGAIGSSSERNRATLPTLFSLSDTEFRGEYEDLHYAMARYTCQWLDQHGQLWPFYHAWRDNVESDPTGERAFEQVVGKTLSEANDDWKRWVSGLAKVD